MNERLRPKPDAEIVPDALTKRVLARASELDALRRAGATVAELRAAATEAGISPEAFDAALAEMRADQSTQVSPNVRTRSRSKMLLVVALAAALAAGLVFATGRSVANVQPKVEQRP